MKYELPDIVHICVAPTFKYLKIIKVKLFMLVVYSIHYFLVHHTAYKKNKSFAKPLAALAKLHITAR